MATPRQVLQGTTYLITCRCTDRRFLLTPDGAVRAAFLYCLAFAAQLTGLQVHAVCLMSNHYHLVVTDVLGVLPDFMQWLNRHTANCLKIHRSWRGCFWEPSERYSAVALVTPEAVLEKLVYVIANPVAAGLVRRAREWPGLLTLPRHWLGRQFKTKRPTGYFRGEKGLAPTIQFSIPAQFAEWDREEFIRLVERRISERERAIEEEMRKAGRKFLGADKVRRQDPRARPKTKERRGTRNPEFAAVTKKELREAEKKLRTFRWSYFEASKQYRLGRHDVEFPQGTWWFVRHVGVRCCPGELLHPSTRRGG